MDDKLSENERLRNKIRELTDAIENAKSKPAWQRQKWEQYFPGNQSKLNLNSSYGTNFSMSDYRLPMRQTLSNTHHNAHPYAGGIASHNVRKTSGWKKFNACEDTHSKTHMLSFSDLSSNKKSTVNTNVPSSSKVDIPLCRPRASAEEVLKNARSDVNRKVFQQKVEKMKTNIAELQKALSERLVSSPSKQKSGTNKVSYSSSSASDVSNELSDSIHKPPKHTEAVVHSLPRSLSESCISAVNIDPHLTTKSSVLSNQNHHHSANSFLSHSSFSGRICCGKSEKDKKHLHFRDKSHQFYDSTSDSQGSDSDLISISKYKLARLNSSPFKTIVHKSCSIKPNCAESYGCEANIYKNLKNNLNASQSNSESVKALSETSKRASKFLHKSKYSLQRVKSNCKKPLSVKKAVPSGSFTPTKFISLSKFAIKRVRRSLSDENKNGSQASSGASTVLTPFKSKADWSYTGMSRPYDTYCPRFDALKHYKQDQSHRFRQRYKTRISYYQKKYQFPYKQHYYSKKIWKYSGYPHSKMYRKNQRDELHTQYSSRFGNAAGNPTFRRQFTWHPTTSSNHCSRYVNRRIQQLKQEIPFNPRHKLDRRHVSNRDTDVNYVVINGLLYKSNSKKLVKATPAKTVLDGSVTKSVSESPTKSAPIADKPSVTGMKNVTLKDMKTVIVRGVKFKVDKHGKSLTRIAQPDVGKVSENSTKESSLQSRAHISRIDIGGVTYMQTKPGTLERVNSVKTRVAAVRVVNKTIHRAAGKYKKDNTKVLNKKKYCMFFNRFSKCNRKEKCPYMHDPDKIAVCTRFLRGTCKSKDCQFSHKVSGNKVPTCSFFVLGKCSRIDCPYPHVNVNREAAVCEDFLKGFCPSGVKCKKKHILQCPEYFHTGVCTHGDKCKLQHKKTKEKRQKRIPRQEPKSVSTSATVASSETDPGMALLSSPDASVAKSGNMSDTLATSTDKAISSSPLKRKLPAYISLKTNDSSVPVSEHRKNKQSLNEKLTLKIRPQF